MSRTEIWLPKEDTDQKTETPLSSGVTDLLTKRNRLVSKHGKINTSRRVEDQEETFVEEFFISLIDLRWSVTFIGFAASFFFSWLGFAVLWYLVANIHGDLEENLPSSHTKCVTAIKDFTSCFLFSIETQHTIGYGGRSTTEQCSIAIILMSLQSILGVAIQACMAGIIYAKFTKPISRGETIIFSKNALISLRNGSLWLLVRLADLRPHHLIESHVTGQFLASISTEEGELIPHHLETIKFSSSMEEEIDYIQLYWPLVVGHKIDSSSPLYEISARDLQKRLFEIIITLEGTTPETGNTVQVRTSYLPSEVLWGQRFQHSAVEYDSKEDKYAVTYKSLNLFEQDMTPMGSAKELDEQMKMN